ncbi:ABC transporter permease [Kribbella sp. NPDC004875]|uniref:ABC transporter permease n=1 Tax=Kribbella sp. NPDC004875 TaxID=3364107 RepID=UPI0036A982D7
MMRSLRIAWILVCCSVVGLVVACALFPGLFTSADPIRGLVADRLRPPSSAHLLGTDELGRDVLSRVVHGASLSLQAAVIAVTVAVVAGSTVGLVAGTGSRSIDDFLMRVVEVMLSIPSFLLVLAIVLALGFGTIHVAVAVGISASASSARIIRSEAVRVRTSGYVEAARACGTRWPVTIVRHILPNSLTPVAALASVEFGNAVLAVAALSFLGFGATPPTPEWGAMIAGGQDYLDSAWWLTACPGLVLTVVVLAANQLAAILRHGAR